MKAAIPAGQQFRAIAYLRWRLFANSFRRKGGKGELVAKIVVYPVFAAFIIGPSVGAGLGSWALVSNDQLELLPLVFLAIFVLQILVSINISPPALNFDPESLIRFPLNFSRYLVVRSFLGLLSAANVIGTAALLSAALGVTLARPALGGVAFTAAILVAVTNMFFLRMVFAWVDRWLSTRRAREIFTGLIIFFSVGIQYLNVTLNPGFNEHNGEAARRKLAAAMRLYNSSQTILSHLHPELGGYAIVNAEHHAWAYCAGDLVGVALFGALFVAVFAWRMEREFRGENLSETGGGSTRLKPVVSSTSMTAAVSTASTLSVPSPAPSRTEYMPVLSTLLLKEFTYVRRNSSQLYALLIPVAMVFIFAGRMGSQGAKGWAFPAGVLYGTLTASALAFNSFGLDAEGVQFYFLAPVKFRTIVLAKNLFGFALTLVQALIVYAVVRYVAGPIEPTLVLATLCWLVFAVLMNVTFGNIRSITAPKKMDPGKISRRQASQLSALLSVLIVLVTGALGAGILFLGSWLKLPWLPSMVLLALAVGASAIYLAGLGGVDALASRNRETMLMELTKAS